MALTVTFLSVFWALITPVRQVFTAEASPGASALAAAGQSAGWAPAFALTPVEMFHSHVRCESWVCSLVLSHQCWRRLHVLVHVMALESHPLALGTQTAAAVDQSSLGCADRPWGVEASNLLFCSSGVGCSRTARLLPGKGLFSLLPSSRAVTSFRNGAASRPVPCLCVLLSWQSDAHGPQPSASALTQARGAGSWWHTVNASFCWCR